MMLLKDILYGVRLTAVNGDTNVLVNSLHFDSRAVAMDDVFIAVRGTLTDGHNYIQKAAEAGAKAIVCEDFPQLMVNGITYLQVQNAAAALAMMASNFYGTPSKNLKLIGITGTNGKTTVSTLLYRLFKNAGYKVGLISTIKVMVDERSYETSHTTPDAITINKHLQLMNEAGVEFCFMEVSSHGIAQKRTEGLQFEGAIFTNLSHDHLDYHKTFAAYRDTKKKLFDGLSKTAFALTNIDDKNGQVMLQNTKARKFMRTGNENVITVVGCGGDRDKSKRPVMGHIASEMSNQVIFTSDNPRSEPPEAIIEEIEAGVEPQNSHKVLAIENRRQAIKAACKLAASNDIVLVAGKGHETYQETNGNRVHFDDFKEVKEALYGLDK